MDQWDKARRLVLSRDGEKCLFCLGEATDVHHRVVKGMGGTSDPYIAFGPANLISLCREHHNWVHANPAQAYKLGFLVHSWDDPAEIPIMVRPGTVLVKLLPNGDLERAGDELLF